MDLRKTSLGDLELFIELAMLGSLREVARTRGMEVAQLSRSLGRLETRVGKVLFARSHRGLILTPEGGAFRMIVEKSLKDLGFFSGSESLLHVDRLPNLEGVGAPSFLMTSLVLPLTGELKKSEVINDARIVELPPDRLVLSGLRGIISVAFHAGKLDWPRTWETHNVGKLRWNLYASKKFYSKKRMSEAQVKKEKFVYPVYWSPEGLREAEDQCPVSLRLRQKAAGVSSSWMALEHLDSYPCLSFLPESLVNPERDDRFYVIKVGDWKPVIQDVYVSAQVDRISKKLLTHMRDLAKSLTA